jgi:hypothetical protein
MECLYDFYVGGFGRSPEVNSIKSQRKEVCKLIYIFKRWI